MKISFFKTGKPKTFNYQPLYYDERKEELENIKKQIQGDSEDDVVERIRSNIHRSWRESYERRRGKGAVSGSRLIIYLIILGLLIYLIFFAKFFYK